MTTLHAVDDWPGGARPLHLDASAGIRIVLDGPALRVKRQGQADRWFPLRRISRVVVHSRAEWATDSLMACADAGIPVVFLAINGEVRGRLLGVPGDRQDTFQRFVDLLDRPDWTERYDQWVEAMEYRYWLAARRALRAPRERRPKAQRLLWLEARAAQCSDQLTAVRTRMWLRGLVHAWTASRLLDHGFGAQSELGQDGKPDLVADLTDILRWPLEPARLGWLNSRRKAAQRDAAAPVPVRRRDIIGLFEAHQSRVQRATNELMHRFHAWLVEMG